MRSQRVALVVGANGGFGNEVMRSLLRHGWHVRALARNEQPNRLQHAHLEWRNGDAMNRQDVVDAARDVGVIVHAVNPANYHNWRGLSLPMLDNTIAAAANSGARVVLPGSLYNYGLDTYPLIDEEAPQSPETRKGKIRVEMEERLRDACWEGDIKALVIRCGDFFGPRSQGSSWLSAGWVIPARPIRFVLNPGTPEAGHSWAYLPDVAETVARLLDNERSLQRFESFHFKGHFITNEAMAHTICDVAGISRRRVLSFPWWMIRATAFVEVCREMLEMQYLWKAAAELDNGRLVARLGTEPHTPLSEALRTTFAALGCMPSLRACMTRAKTTT